MQQHGCVFCQQRDGGCTSYVCLHLVGAVVLRLVGQQDVHPLARCCDLRTKASKSERANYVTTSAASISRH
jgi:hypothetical protein